MTPFGEKLRALRAARGATLKEMAQAIGVSSAYLSSLEHGRRGRPSWYLIQRIITYFNVIWDEAEELVKLANLSHPRIVARTAGLSPRATELCNRLAASVHDLREDDLAILLKVLNEAIGRSKRIKIRE